MDAVTTGWGTIPLVQLVATGVVLVALAVIVALTVWGRRSARTAREAADRAEAAQLPDQPTASAQMGASRTFQVGATLGLHVVPLRTGFRFSATVRVNGADLTVTYPLPEEMAGQIAATLTRSHG